jgi:hypothetical protein
MKYRQVWKISHGRNSYRLGRYGTDYDTFKGPCAVCIGSMRNLPQITLLQIDTIDRDLLKPDRVEDDIDLIGPIIFEGPRDEAIEVFKWYVGMLG